MQDFCGRLLKRFRQIHMLHVQFFFGSDSSSLVSNRRHVIRPCFAAWRSGEVWDLQPADVHISTRPSTSRRLSPSANRLLILQHTWSWCWAARPRLSWSFQSLALPSCIIIVMVIMMMIMLITITILIIIDHDGHNHHDPHGHSHQRDQNEHFSQPHVIVIILDMCFARKPIGRWHHRPYPSRCCCLASLPSKLALVLLPSRKFEWLKNSRLDSCCKGFRF